MRQSGSSWTCLIWASMHFHDRSSVGLQNLGLLKIFKGFLGFFVRRLDTKVRPKSTWKTSYTTPLLLFMDYSVNNCKHFINWLRDWTIVFTTIHEWLAVNKEGEHRLPRKNEAEVDESEKSQWKYKSEVYLKINNKNKKPKNLKCTSEVF